MAQDLVGAARGVVDSFNAADWERCKSILSEDSIYDEVGTSRCLTRHDEIIPVLRWPRGCQTSRERLIMPSRWETPSCWK